MSLVKTLILPLLLKIYGFDDVKAMSAILAQKKHSLKNVEEAAQIFIEYGDLIRGVIRSQVKDISLRDDIFHDFFISLIFRPVPENVTNTRSYLYKAITNDIIDAKRKWIRYHNHLHKYTRCFSRRIEDCPETTIANIEESYKMFELIEKRLSSSEAQAIKLRYSSELTNCEIARHMRITPESASRYISVGLKRLRKSLPRD